MLPGLFFWQLLTPNPADRMRIAGGDFTAQYFPLRAFTAQEWVKGRLPLWNPSLYGGQPALADIQSGALYPPHVIEALLLGWGGPLLGRDVGFPLWALELQVITHFSLAAVGTYLFARQTAWQNGVSLRRARFGGLIAALVFTYSGYLTGFPVQQMTILEVSAWLPWVLWGLRERGANERGSEWRMANERIINENSPSVIHPSSIHHSLIRHTCHVGTPMRHSSIRHSLGGALAFAMAILAGHPQTVLYIFYLSLAYATFRVYQCWRDNAGTKGEAARGETGKGKTSFAHSLIRAFAPWLITVLLGSAMAAAQLLPTLEFITYSLRATLSYQAVSTGLPLPELISILYPGFRGGSPEYVGIVTLVFISVALLVSRNAKRGRVAAGDIFFWAGAGLVSLLLAFGGHTFLYPLFYLLTPGFNAVRQQERAFLVYSFSAAMLAGWGAVALTGPFTRLSRVSYTRFERRWRYGAGLAFGLTAFFIYGSALSRDDKVNLFTGVLHHHMFGLIILTGTLLLLNLRGRRWLRRPWGMSLLGVWLIFNLFTVNWRFNLEKSPSPAPFTPDHVTEFLQANLPTFPTPHRSSLPERLVSGGLLPGGNSAAAVYQLQDLTGNTPLQIAAVNTFFQRMPAWRAWQLMNVRYIVDKRDLTGAGLALVFEGNQTKVFEMKDPFPRAWFVAETELITTDSQALDRLAADDFDLRHKAIVDRPISASLSQPLTSTVTITHFSPTYLTADVVASGPHLLVLSQIDYSGWQAELDGQPTDLRRVNVIQQGVLIPPGTHHLQLTFSPTSFWLGLMISGVGILIGMTMLIGKRRNLIKSGCHSEGNCDILIY